MTSAEISELREFISGELRKVYEGLGELRGEVGELRGGLAELTARVDQMHDEQLRFQELVGRHFGDVLSRLGKVEILGEARDHDFKVFGESLQGVDQKLDAFREEVADRFDRLDYRVDRLEAA